ncbi:hypothetical protein CWI38_0779p0020 [Hamiltosporidium tvaerminnensis]|uniref:Uncharacterized protein n=1 Tax=Hamiltosporidium tvaerminnensis TaxID=1176355 RepID=A0A4Q9LUP4_9MICR|nr:hypothetical protein CWI38_0779p0020 [Hamiltosporidium tvaerminnensis]
MAKKNQRNIIKTLKKISWDLLSTFVNMMLIYGIFIAPFLRDKQNFSAPAFPKHFILLFLFTMIRHMYNSRFSKEYIIIRQEFTCLLFTLFSTIIDEFLEKHPLNFDEKSNEIFFVIYPIFIILFRANILINLFKFKVKNDSKLEHLFYLFISVYAISVAETLFKPMIFTTTQLFSFRIFIYSIELILVPFISWYIALSQVTAFLIFYFSIIFTLDSKFLYWVTSNPYNLLHSV